MYAIPPAVAANAVAAYTRGGDTVRTRAVDLTALVRRLRRDELQPEAAAGRQTALARIAELDAAVPDLPSADDADLLDALPYLALNLAHAPQNLLRPLFEAARLRIQLHQESDDVTLTVTLPENLLPDLAETAKRIEHAMPDAQVADRPDVQMLLVPPTGFEPVLPP